LVGLAARAISSGRESRHIFSYVFTPHPVHVARRRGCARFRNSGACARAIGRRPPCGVSPRWTCHCDVSGFVTSVEHRCPPRCAPARHASSAPYVCTISYRGVHTCPERVCAAPVNYTTLRFRWNQRTRPPGHVHHAREPGPVARAGDCEPRFRLLALAGANGVGGGKAYPRTAGEYLPRVVERVVAGRGAWSLTPPHLVVCYRDMETLSRYPLVTVYIQLL
jgi:hypothetical protein